ncbi:hypothetical protein ACIGHG_08550 [Bacillus sp. NPDC077411]|uniref:hypothetical protein n=1 Tax=Bacillus sp. NPDC077411 TaxID=3363947 RepID=UPI0037C86A4A
MKESKSNVMSSEILEELKIVLKELIIMSYTNETVRHFLDDLHEVLIKNKETASEDLSTALKKLQEKHIPDGV